jgi:hypothetical protein
VHAGCYEKAGTRLAALDHGKGDLDVIERPHVALLGAWDTGTERREVHDQLTADRPSFVFMLLEPGPA